MVRGLPKLDLQPLKRLWWRWMVFRQWWVGKVLSGIYGMPMMVVPKGFVNVAAAVVLWCVQDGARQVVMVRNPKAKDNRARLVSCMGMGAQGDMSIALQAALETQVGGTFARTVGKGMLAVDRVAAAPVFSYTDEENGIVSPVQVLVWAVQIQPVQLELLKAGSGLEVMIVPESGLAQTNVSPTHKAIWETAQRHIPQLKSNRKGRGDGVELVEEQVAAAKAGKGPRVLH